MEKIYRDPLNDVALLKINPAEHLDHTLTPVELGDSENLQVGQLVIAIGNDFDSGQFCGRNANDF